MSKTSSARKAQQIDPWRRDIEPIVIVKHALDTGQRSELAESLLDALEDSLRIFEDHRILVFRLQWISTSITPFPQESKKEHYCHRQG
jgi:hypothetical protein